MITDRDMDIIRHLEKYKYATIQQLEKIFFKDRGYSYNLVRRRLLEIKKHGYVIVRKDTEKNRNIYLYNEKDIKMPSQHRIYILDVLAELHYLGWNVETFEVEKRWGEGKFISDAYAVFAVANKRRYRRFVEVQTSNNHHNCEKYDVLFKERIVQEELQITDDRFPKIILVSDRNYPQINLKHTYVYQVDLKMHGLPDILVE